MTSRGVAPSPTQRSFPEPVLFFLCTVGARFSPPRACASKPSDPTHMLHRASLTYEMDSYSVSLFANNIFDKYAVVSVANDRSRIGVNDGIAVRYYRQAVVNPRTVGLEARFSF